MTIEPDNQEFDNIEKLIDQIVHIDIAGNRDVDLIYKLDVLERTIELLRIKHKGLKNNLSIEDYVQGNIRADLNCMRFSMPLEYYDSGTGTPPIRVQPHLLLFLAIFHNREYRVLEIIEQFIARLSAQSKQLTMLDFKKTKTGVFRCFTNTRFAANVLRSYGLLKFTRKEAYKTWVLSLPGFLVASVVLNKYQNQWKLPEHHKIYNFDLHKDIWDAWESMKTYKEYLHKLTQICKPNADIFKTFEPVLKKAYELLEKYWQVLQNHKMTVNERHAASIELLGEVEKLPMIEQFYIELSKSLNLDRILNEIK